MHSRRFVSVGIVASLVVTFVLQADNSSALTLLIPGTATKVADLPYRPYSYSDIEVDVAGNLYVSGGAPDAYSSPSILKVTPGGVVSGWSSAPAWDFTMAPGGGGYSAGGSSCMCIDQISSAGMATPLRQDTLSWAWVALSSDGTLYADIFAGAGLGIYKIDRGTGLPTAVVPGGPGPTGYGFYTGMATSGNELYVLGSLDSGGASFRMFRLDGVTLTPVASPPHGGFDLVHGPGNLFFTVTNYGGPPSSPELWSIDSATGAVHEVAAGLVSTYGGGFDATGYDPGSGILYLIERDPNSPPFFPPSSHIWALRLNYATPANITSWGSVKALYRK